MEEIPQMDFVRQDMLLIWLKRNNRTKAEIARSLEVGDVTVSRWFSANTIPVKRHEQLVKLGIPADLLPRPVDITPGPKRKKIKN